MKGFIAVWGDGQQACCSFVYSEKKNCSHHFPLSLAPNGRRLKTKSHLPFQTELGYSTEQPGQEGSSDSLLCLACSRHGKEGLFKMVKYALIIIQHSIIIPKLQYSMTETAPGTATLLRPLHLSALCIFELYTENKLMFPYWKGGGKLWQLINTLAGFTSFCLLNLNSMVCDMTNIITSPVSVAVDSSILIA